MYRLRPAKVFCKYMEKILHSLTVKRNCEDPDKYLILKDNYHLIHRTVSGILSDLKHSGPLIFNEDNFPRIYSYAFNFCKISRNKLDTESLERYLDGVGKNIDLQTDEINIFIDMFRCALICNINSICGDENKKNELLSSLDSIRFLQEYTFDDIYEKISQCEAVLRSDEWYERMDKESKSLYRHRLSVIAKRQNKTEKEVAVELSERSSYATDDISRHIGYQLFDKPHGNYYIILSVCIPVIVAIITGILTRSIILGIVCVLPYWEIFRALFEFVLSKCVKSYMIPGLEMKNGVPKTLVTVITLMKDKSDAAQILAKIRKYSYSNECRGMMFGALIDLNESGSQLSDKEASAIEYLKNGIKKLNKEKNIFFVAVRKRTLNNKGLYGGKERKRGAVCEFLNTVAGVSSFDNEFLLLEGDFRHAKYFTALDSDTVPGIDSVRRLVGVLEHPLSRPVLAEDNKTVLSGYAIACPRMDVSLSSACRNVFTRIISGFGGVEVYGNVSFSVYQDLFGEGIFAGKGVINIKIFNMLTADLFPENTILSHDILESNLLRCAYVSDVSFTDNVPKNVLSFTERMHRWIRGDIQNSAYILPNIKTKYGKIHNPFSFLSKYKLFDNVRRAFIAPAQFILILSGIFYGPLPIYIALISFFLTFILSLVDILISIGSFSTVRYRTKTFSPIIQNFLQCANNLIFLPYFAYMNVDACVKACFRLITKKNLLEWKTASDVDEALRGGIYEYLIRMWPQYLGIIAFLSFITLPFGIVWILSVLVAYFMSVVKNKKPQHSRDVTQDLKDMWGYFHDFLNENNNYLPPDNYQEQPLGLCAQRTSPTNIGLAALCCLGAYDCKFISSQELLELLNNMLNTLEKLDKWNGHLYNWYNTVTLKPLYPRYVSSVDNGNYAAFMYALRNGLMELGDDFEICIARIDLLLSATDFSLLYNSRKHLFYIGYDAEKEEYTSSYYDLYASESRLLSYYSIAMRQVNIKNWRSISRFIVRKNGYPGVKSWSGTMFEYFMPNILLPVCKGSLCDEMLDFCINEQIKYAGNHPWGISECGIYSFDKSLVYQYKACGVPALALKSDSDNDMVISPYSVYLTLPFAPDKALQNLQKIFQQNMYGKYGFYESIDYTATRTGGSPCIVHSYMVHHIGMSFLSCINYKYDNKMQNRFLSYRMQAFLSLTEEKLPASVIKYADAPIKKNIRERYSRKSEEFSVLNPIHPTVKCFSNGSFVSVVTDCGNGNIIYKNSDVTRYRSGTVPQGTFVFFRSGKGVMGLTYSPLYDTNAAYRTFFDDGEATFSSRRHEFEGRISVTSDVECNCEIREIAIKNNSARLKSGTILIYMEPTILKRTDEEVHPAFSSLFLESIYEGKILYIHRRVQDNEENDLWMAVALSLDYDFELSRFRVLDRIKGLSGIISAFDKKFSNDVRGPVDACIALKADLEIKSRGVKFVKLYTCVASSKQKATEELNKLFNKNFDEIKQTRVTLIQSIYNKFNIKKEDVCLAELITSALYNRLPGKFRPAEYRNSLGIERLWKYGVSGDYPIILIKTDETCTDKCAEFINAFRILRFNKVDCDMVFCFSEGGRYDRPVYNKLRDMIQSFGMTEFLDTKCGIMFANVENMDEFSMFSSICLFYADLRKGWKVNVNKEKYYPLRLTQGEPAKIKYYYKTGVGGFTTNGFGIDDKNSVSSRAPWCLILCNDDFGTIVSDSSLGYTYAYNSQLNKITPWDNDAVLDNYGEKLYMRQNNKTYDIMRDSSVIFEKNSASYKVHCGNVTVTADVFVCVHKKAKIIHLHVVNPDSSSCIFTYETDVILSNKRMFGAINRNSDRHAVYWSNPLCRYNPKGVCAVTGTDCGTSSKGPVWTSKPGTSKDTYFVLLYGKDEHEAINLTSYFTQRDNCKKEQLEVQNLYSLQSTIKIKTQNTSLDLFYNTFLYEQIVKSRIKARAGFFQCSGAYGFRDQLQDCMGIDTTEPSYLRKQIVRAASHQFEEGDVMHWWHEGINTEGVRTRCSDDLIWLPYCVCDYILKTGDKGVLDCEIPYLTAPVLQDGEYEKLITAQRTDNTESLYLHCKKALSFAYRTGEHGLILFGGGDWNDGMNMVGRHGRGETVWGSIFCSMALYKFSKYAKEVGDSEFGDKCIEFSSQLRRSVEKNAWDGKWYLRGYTDDGVKIGSEDSEFCKIDLLPQSFASMAGEYDNARVNSGMDNAWKYLVDTQNNLVKLFSPAYNISRNNPGYISRYMDGIRENGGQYTHSAVWYSSALIDCGRTDDAMRILDMLNPIRHTNTPEDVDNYRLEPYVLAADVYSNPAHQGMGGWSHYTGSAGWYYKVITEKILGIERKNNAIYINPSLPSYMGEYKAELYIDMTTVTLSVERAEPPCFTVDGVQAECIPLDGNKHTAVLRYIV